jgi:hypothetical protein
MTTLILPPRYTDDSIALWRAATAMGWTVMRLQGWRVTPDPPIDEPVPYGEPLFVATVAEQLGLAALEPPFDLLARMPERFRRRHVQFRRGADIASYRFPAFLKPADDKCFPAAVYQSATELGRFAIPDAAPILRSEVVSWDVEFRCFIAGRRCLTLSPYARNGALALANDGSWPSSDAELSGASDFLQGLLSCAEVELPPAVAIDLGMIAGRGWAVVEANPCWGAGIYGCDPQQVPMALRFGVMPAAALRQEDKRWIAERSVDSAQAPAYASRSSE